MSTTTVSREIRLASRPNGWPTSENFATAEVELPELEDGQILVRKERPVGFVIPALRRETI